jgi:hypothetical protein
MTTDNELLERHFDEYTRSVAQERLLIKYENGVWRFYELELNADEDPDVCHPLTVDKNGVCDGCGNEYGKDAKQCECWLCDYVNEDGTKRVLITMYAEPLDGDTNNYCLNDDWCIWYGPATPMIARARKRWGEDLQYHNVRHDSYGDWTLGRYLSPMEAGVNRVGFVMSIPKEGFTPDPMQTAYTDYEDAVEELELPEICEGCNEPVSQLKGNLCVRCSNVSNTDTHEVIMVNGRHYCQNCDKYLVEDDAYEQGCCSKTDPNIESGKVCKDCS